MRLQKVDDHLMSIIPRRRFVNITIHTFHLLIPSLVVAVAHHYIGEIEYSQPLPSDCLLICMFIIVILVYILEA